MGFKNSKKIWRRRIVVFDLDNTLSESRSQIDGEMAGLICALLDKISVAVISGASFSLFSEQLLSRLSCREKFDRLFILPTSGAELWIYKNSKWNIIYENPMPEGLRKKAIDIVARAAGIKAGDKKKYIEDRKTQITYAALGINAPIEEKKKYDPDQLKRRKFVSRIINLLPEFSLRIGGTSSIDITIKGIDKSFGITRLLSFAKINPKDAFFIGDAFYEGGNDESVKHVGIRVVEVRGPKYTKNIIREFIKNYE